jgi:hypothetical protein
VGIGRRYAANALNGSGEKMSKDAPSDNQHSAYVGWWAAAIVLLVTFAGSATVWFIYHPW